MEPSSSSAARWCMLRRVRRYLARLFLGFALAFTQLGATVHALSHVEAPSGTKHYPGDTGQNCPICHAFSAASALAPPSAPAATPLETEHVQQQREPWFAAALDSFFTFARGPPRHPDV
jgi:hypothetical protein